MTTSVEVKVFGSVTFQLLGNEVFSSEWGASVRCGADDPRDIEVNQTTAAADVGAKFASADSARSKLLSMAIVGDRVAMRAYRGCGLRTLVDETQRYVNENEQTGRLVYKATYTYPADPE